METKSKNPRTGAPVLRAVLPNTARPLQVIHESDAISKLSLLIFGLGNLVNRQIGRGLILLAIEAGYIAYMAAFGIAAMGDFFTLGTALQEEVWDEALGIFVYTKGDNSMLCMLYGVITIVLTAIVIAVAYMSLKSAYCTQKRKERGMHIPTFRDDLQLPAGGEHPRPSDGLPLLRHPGLYHHPAGIHDPHRVHQL